MKKLLSVLLITSILLSCQEKIKEQKIEMNQSKKVEKVEKKKFVDIGLEDIITNVTLEDRNLLIRELGKPHKHNDFLTIKTDKEPIIIVFETIDGKQTYTGVQNVYNSHNEKHENVFTTLNEKQLKKLAETGFSGWKD